MNEKIKVILLKPGQDASVIEISKKDNSFLDDMYKHLECDTVDVAERKVDGKYFDFWVDDNGLFKDKLFTSCYNLENKEGYCHEVLCGNILIANHDEEGKTTSLSEDDIKLIFKNLKRLDSRFSYNPVVFHSSFGTIRMKQSSQYLTYQIY